MLFLCFSSDTDLEGPWPNYPLSWHEWNSDTAYDKKAWQLPRKLFYQSHKYTWQNSFIFPIGFHGAKLEFYISAWHFYFCRNL